MTGGNKKRATATAMELTDMGDQLQAIQQSLKKLNDELIGVTPENSVEKTSLCDQSTVRHLLESIEQSVGVIANSGSVDDTISKSLRAALTSNRNLSRVSDIRGRDVNEEQRQLLAEFEARKSALTTVSDGATFQGRTLDDVKAGIPAEYLENTTVVISNYLDVQLTSPGLFTPAGIEFDEVPATIASAQREVFTYHSSNTTASACGALISYLVEGADLRLAVDFYCNNDGSICVGLAFIPQNVQVHDGKLYTLIRSIGAVQPRIRRDCQHSAVHVTQQWASVITAGDLRATATMTPGPKAELRVEILRADRIPRNGATQTPNEVFSSLLIPLVNDAKLLGKPAEDIRRSMGIRGCVIDITNLLNVPLEDAVHVLQLQEQHDFMPFGMFAFTREAFFASSSLQVKGIFSYRIASTDLRLVVSFNALTQGNSFTIAFLPMSAASTESTLTSLMESLNQQDDLGLTLRTDKKLAYTRNGPQIASMRNLRVWAHMTDEDQALLRIVVYTE